MDNIPVCGWRSNSNSSNQYMFYIYFKTLFLDYDGGQAFREEAARRISAVIEPSQYPQIEGM